MWGGVEVWTNSLHLCVEGWTFGLTHCNLWGGMVVWADSLYFCAGGVKVWTDLLYFVGEDGGLG